MNELTSEKRHEIFLDYCASYDFVLTAEFDRWLVDNQFFTAPASTKYHGAYEGGLFDHSLAVTNRLSKLTEDNRLVWKRPQSPLVVGMFHDLCKCDQYIKAPGIRTDDPRFDMIQYDAGFHYEYNDKTLLKGHGAKSVMLISQFFALTEEEMLCIRYHMGPYEKEEWTEFDLAIRKYQNVYWTHAADMLASKVDNI